jgi:hypothetical protein
VVTVGGLLLLGGLLFLLGPTILRFVELLLEGGPDALNEIFDTLL